MPSMATGCPPTMAPTMPARKTAGEISATHYKRNCSDFVLPLTLIGTAAAVILFPGFLISIPPVNGKFFATEVVTGAQVLVHGIVLLIVLGILFYLLLRYYGICK
jgi:hypothetical protein